MENFANSEVISSMSQNVFRPGKIPKLKIWNILKYFNKKLYKTQTFLIKLVQDQIMSYVIHIIVLLLCKQLSHLIVLSNFLFQYNFF